MTRGIEGLAERTGVVVLNWNGAQDTRDCLASLREMVIRPSHTIVVDNASNDGLERVVAESFTTVQWIQAGHNLGFAGGNNLGIRHALDLGADYVWILNNDTEVDRYALETLLTRVAEDPTIGLCGSTLVHHAPPHRVQALAGASYDRVLGRARGIGAGQPTSNLPPVAEVEQQLSYVIGASMLATRPFLEQAGMLDEGYFLFYEELDWAARMPEGMRLGWAPGSVVYHKDGATIGKNQGNDSSSEKRLRYEYFLTRSKIRYTWRHDGLRLPSILVGILAAFLSRLARCQFTRAWVMLRAWVAIATGIGMPKLARQFLDRRSP